LNVTTGTYDMTVILVTVNGIVRAYDMTVGLVTVGGIVRSYDNLRLLAFDGTTRVFDVTR
jgi:hypothetical protein